MSLMQSKKMNGKCPYCGLCIPVACQILRVGESVVVGLKLTDGVCVQRMLGCIWQCFYSSCLRFWLKWFLRILTGRCELQRICARCKAGALRTSQIGEESGYMWTRLVYVCLKN